MPLVAQAPASREAADEIGSHCTIRELTREGEAAEEIVALAKKTPCDLLVIGARHRRWFDSTVPGSTTARAVRHTPCPVAIVVAQGVVDRLALNVPEEHRPRRTATGDGKAVRFNHVITQDADLLHGVLEFAHVSGPPMSQQNLLNFRCEDEMGLG